ncbi:hypothetical protein K504DRAFT_218747 [Pleomassaria siparia CBS 279.74]|uniref:Uncharacterized protein n=1 Tax=Pleomassaria siparia CBS 279.74 TaxID=1314801 RepID=A0A6G1KFR9_9PLEO|nr:hypothetical protein K504DRAFT_218747 [Pleomassaria siparia CBS 279.74]
MIARQSARQSDDDRHNKPSDKLQLPSDKLQLPTATYVRPQKHIAIPFCFPLSLSPPVFFLIHMAPYRPHLFPQCLQIFLCVYYFSIYPALDLIHRERLYRRGSGHEHVYDGCMSVVTYDVAWRIYWEAVLYSAKSKPLRRNRLGRHRMASSIVLCKHSYEDSTRIKTDLILPWPRCSLLSSTCASFELNFYLTSAFPLGSSQIHFCIESWPPSFVINYRVESRPPRSAGHGVMAHVGLESRRRGILGMLLLDPTAKDNLIN